MVSSRDGIQLRDSGSGAELLATVLPLFVTDTWYYYSHFTDGSIPAVTCSRSQSQEAVEAGFEPSCLHHQSPCICQFAPRPAFGSPPASLPSVRPSGIFWVRTCAADSRGSREPILWSGKADFISVQSCLGLALGELPNPADTFPPAKAAEWVGSPGGPRGAVTPAPQMSLSTRGRAGMPASSALATISFPQGIYWFQLLHCLSHFLSALVRSQKKPQETI